tara:strand:+ start:883 stop:1047 length:165 start_codon:yes stop_codon:yes gene_type:complete
MFDVYSVAARLLDSEYCAAAPMSFLMSWHGNNWAMFVWKFILSVFGWHNRNQWK